MAAYRVVLTPAAERQFAKLSHQAREMIAAALVALAGNPRPEGCVKLAGGEDNHGLHEFKLLIENPEYARSASDNTASSTRF